MLSNAEIETITQLASSLAVTITEAVVKTAEELAKTDPQGERLIQFAVLVHAKGLQPPKKIGDMVRITP